MLLLLWYLFGTRAFWDFEFNQLIQLKTGNYDKAHPVFHTIFCGGLLKIYQSLHTIAFAQIIAFSVALYSICWWAKRSGLSIIYACGAIVGIVVFTYPYAHYVVKDSFMLSSFIIATTGLMAWNQRPDLTSAILAAIGLTGVGLFRYDGQASVLLVSIAVVTLSIWNKKIRKQAYIIAFIPLLALVSGHLILPACVNARSEMTGTKLAMPADLICEVIVRGGDISPDDLKKAEQLIMPKELMFHLHKLGHEYQGEKYIWGMGFADNKEFKRYSFAYNLKDKGAELLPLCGRVIIKNPVITIQHLFQQGKMLWDIRAEHDRSVYIKSPINPISLCFYMGMLVLILIIRNRCGIQYLLSFIPFITVTSVIALIATTYEMRYGLPIIPAGILAIGYARTLIRHNDCGKAEA